MVTVFLVKFMDNKELIKIALKASENAYAPYSHYCVGAALVANDESVYSGCNIENASFSATNCAERSAFFSAINDGKRSFSKIAIVATKDGVIDRAVTPCGICRQVMREFCNDDFIIITAKSVDEYSEFTLSELLPHSFSANNL